MTTSTCVRGAVPALSPIAATVQAGLTATPRQLPPWLFYDARGSTLFEAITRLPEYYLTRAEREIFAERTTALLDAALPAGATVVELGAGTATKTQLLLEALVARDGRAHYVPIDVSGSALAEARQRLARQAPRVDVTPWEMPTEAAMPEADSACCSAPVRAALAACSSSSAAPPTCCDVAETPLTKPRMLAAMVLKATPI